MFFHRPFVHYFIQSFIHLFIHLVSTHTVSTGCHSFIHSFIHSFWGRARYVVSPDIDQMLVWCCQAVYNAGPTWNQPWPNFSCFQGYNYLIYVAHLTHLVISRRWPSIKATLGQHLGFAKYLISPTPCNTRRWANVGFTLNNCLQHWPNIKPILAQRVALVGTTELEKMVLPDRAISWWLRW